MFIVGARSIGDIILSSSEEEFYLEGVALLPWLISHIWHRLYA